MQIGQVAARTGLAPSAIRYYEAQDLLQPPARVAGKRDYGPEVLDRIALIQLAQSVGFQIREIRELVHGGDAKGASQQWELLARTKLRELEEQIVATQSMVGMLTKALACGCPSPLVCDEVLQKER